MLSHRSLKNTTGDKCCSLVLLLFILCVFLYQPCCFGEKTETYDKSVVMIMVVNQEYDFATPWKKGPIG